jgi:hypothetical protein
MSQNVNALNCYIMHKFALFFNTALGLGKLSVCNVAEGSSVRNSSYVGKSVYQ